MVGERYSRRRFVASGAAVAAGAVSWDLLSGVSSWAEAVVAGAPAGFPRDVAVSRRRFVNWAGAIDVEGVWTCAPRSPDEVVAVVNWAWRHRYRVRALGRAHGWSPLALAATPSRRPRVLLVDTTAHLTRMRLAASGPAAVVAQAGANMEELLVFLERAGLGMVAHPAPGDLTVGGVVAIDGHGTAIPARGERRARGETFGSVSNLVLSLTAVVWSERRRRYWACLSGGGNGGFGRQRIRSSHPERTSVAATCRTVLLSIAKPIPGAAAPISGSTAERVGIPIT